MRPLLSACLLLLALAGSAQAAETRAFSLGKLTGAFAHIVALQRECARAHPSDKQMYAVYQGWIDRNQPVVVAGMQAVTKAGLITGAELRKENDDVLARTERRLADTLRDDPKRTTCQTTARKLDSRELELKVLFPDDLRNLGIP